MLNRIKIRGYKSLRKVEVSLKPLSVLFGPNAAGKSNFLDALQLLSKIVSSRTLKEAFEPPYRGKPLESFSFPPNGLKGLLEQEQASFRIEADFSLSDAVVGAVNKQIQEMRRPSGGGSSSPSSPEPIREPVRERNLRYCVEIEMVPTSGILRVVDESLAALNQKGELGGHRHPFLSRKDDKLHLRREGLPTVD
ncbi:AAA family ATPase [Methylacidimicrobium sp. B4]|uniref:AAA family ATPase n=1 Tax=Methylacidimicrobium sp. B4 TaxID=2796139 RepID=UPI001A8EC731|nr:AAA family ATPase [Methylacidimicrobium sp. B4]QSR83893.1 AAA family ATPase [Methylacidimicrobium sp. B4]